MYGFTGIDYISIYERRRDIMREDIDFYALNTIRETEKDIIVEKKTSVENW